MKEQPNIVEKTLSDALLEELEAEIEQEELLLTSQKDSQQVKEEKVWCDPSEECGIEKTPRVSKNKNKKKKKKNNNKK